MKTTIYTAEVIAAMQEQSPLTKEKCNALAEHFNTLYDTDAYSGRGFIAKSRSVDGVTYENAPKSVTKSGDPVIRKDEIVQQIAKFLNSEGLDSLSKASKSDLLKLSAAIEDMVTQDAI